jgi:hypothetical protein
MAPTLGERRGEGDAGEGGGGVAAVSLAEKPAGLWKHLPPSTDTAHGGTVRRPSANQPPTHPSITTGVVE